jgi:hypothetical protein
MAENGNLASAARKSDMMLRHQIQSGGERVYLMMMRLMEIEASAG